MTYPKPTRKKFRGLWITELGHHILAQIDAGTYQFAPGRKPSAGRRQHRKRARK